MEHDSLAILVRALRSFARYRVLLAFVFALCVLALFVSWNRPLSRTSLNSPLDTPDWYSNPKLIHIRRGQPQHDLVDESNADAVNGSAAKDEDPMASALNGDLIGNVLDKGDTCRNSVQGAQMITDDRGYVCSRSAVDAGGCCRLSDPTTRSQYTCESCSTQSNCCEHFEMCTSCCLNPEQKPLLRKVLAQQRPSSGAGTPGARPPTTFSIARQVLFNLVTDQFEFCLARCRTSSQSLLHENSYQSLGRKYCFGLHPFDKPAHPSP